MPPIDGSGAAPTNARSAGLRVRQARHWNCASAPAAVVGPFAVPFLRWRPGWREVGAGLLLDELFVQFVYAETGLRRDLDESALVGKRGLHEVTPPRDVD